MNVGQLIAILDQFAKDLPVLMHSADERQFSEPINAEYFRDDVQLCVLIKGT